MTETEQILYDLFSIVDLDDFVHTIRTHEAKGWDGPKVKLWEDACERAHIILKRVRIPIKFEIKKPREK